MEENTIPQQSSNSNIIVPIIAILMISLAGGWYYGRLQYDKAFSVGKEEGKAEGIEEGKQIGRDELLEEQEQTVEEVINEIQEAANPYDDVTGTNPFSEGYENPFSE